MSRSVVAAISSPSLEWFTCTGAATLLPFMNGESRRSISPSAASRGRLGKPWPLPTGKLYNSSAIRRPSSTASMVEDESRPERERRERLSMVKS